MLRDDSSTDFYWNLLLKLNNVGKSSYHVFFIFHFKTGLVSYSYLPKITNIFSMAVFLHSISIQTMHTMEKHERNTLIIFHSLKAFNGYSYRDLQTWNNEFLKPRKFYMRRNKDKVNFIGTGLYKYVTFFKLMMIKFYRH